MDLFGEFVKNINQKVGKESTSRWECYSDFLDEVYPPGFTTKYKHVQTICKAVDKVFSGEIDRLAIHMPPRHGKSETVTKHVPIKWLVDHPKDSVLVTCYDRTLARDFGRSTKNKIEELGLLSNKKKASDNWETTLGGIYVSRGVGSPPTGKGFNLIVIDDCIKSRQEADSKARRKLIKQWYQEELMSRLHQGGRVIMIGTQWSPYDIYTDAPKLEPGRWHTIKMPALDENNNPLCPELRSLEELLAIKSRMCAEEGSGAWEALYQQNPKPPESEFIKVDRMQKISWLMLPQVMSKVRSWDIAYTKDDGDYTVGILWGIDRNNSLYILDMVRDRWAPEEMEANVRRTAELDGHDVPIFLPEDPAAGKSMTYHWAKALMGYTFTAIPVRSSSGNKTARATPMASSINNGIVALIDASWNQDLLEEFKSFPRGHDDIVDAASMGYSQIALNVGNTLEGLSEASHAMDLQEKYAKENIYSTDFSGSFTDYQSMIW